MVITLQFISLLMLMLVAGVFWGPWFALHRSLHTFNKQEFVKITQTLVHNMGPTMRMLMPVCLLLVLLSVFLSTQKFQLPFYLNILSWIFLVISTLITMVIEVPIVTEISQRTALPDWEMKRDRWLKFHFYRMIAGILSFSLYAAALFVPTIQ